MNESLEILKQTFLGTDNISGHEFWDSDLQDKELHELFHSFGITIYYRNDRYYVMNSEDKILTESEIQNL